MKTHLYLLLFLLLSTSYLLAQNTTIKPDKACINCTTDEPTSSAVLDIQSTDKGILIPRMDSTTRKAILSPAEGLMVYDSTYFSFWYYSNMQWKEISLDDEVEDADADAMNEIQDLELSGNTLSLTDDATTVDLSSFENNWTENSGDVYRDMGTVGIGTDNPTSTSKLEIVGNITGDTGGFAGGLLQLRSLGTATTSGPFITGHNSANGNTQLWYMGSSNNDVQDVALVNRLNGPLFLGTNNTRQMTIDGSGNVGIGTSTPTEKLQVPGTVFANIFRSQGAVDIDGGGAYLGISSSNRTLIGNQRGGSGLGGIEFVNYNDDNTLKNIAMTIDGDGNVGIGTTSPTIKLQISGGTDVSLSSGGGYMTIGSDTDIRRLAFDTNEIQGITSSNTPASISINRQGGAVGINGNDDEGFLSVGPTSGLGGNLKVVGSSKGLFTLAPNATSGDAEIFLAGDKDGNDGIRMIYDDSDNEFQIFEKSGAATFGLATFSTLEFFVGNSIDIAGDGILDDRQGPKFGSVSNVDYNTSQTQFGILLEHKNDVSTETGGIYADGDYVVIFSAGDQNRLLRIIDEDDNTEKFYVDGSGNDFEGSDIRRKENVELITDALEKVLKMRGVEYDWKISENEAKKKEHKRHRTVGVIAQEVEKIVPNLVRTNEQGYKFVDYGGIAPVLIEAIKEQQVQIEAKDDLIQVQNEKINALAKENEAIKARLSKIEALLSGKTTELSTITSTLTSATLAQNAPNPFTEATTISYFIPEGTKNASLQVMNQNGQVIKIIPIQATGKGQVTLQANLLSAGTYSYTLILNGQVMATKQMVLTK